MTQLSSLCDKIVAKLLSPLSSTMCCLSTYSSWSFQRRWEMLVIMVLLLPQACHHSRSPILLLLSIMELWLLPLTGCTEWWIQSITAILHVATAQLSYIYMDWIKTYAPWSFPSCLFWTLCRQATTTKPFPREWLGFVEEETEKEAFCYRISLFAFRPLTLSNHHTPYVATPHCHTITEPNHEAITMWLQSNIPLFWNLWGR